MIFALAVAGRNSKNVAVVKVYLIKIYYIAERFSFESHSAIFMSERR